MNRDRFLLVKELFRRSLQLSAARREALLAQECRDDPELRLEVAELLLHADAASADFLRGVQHPEVGAAPHAELQIPGFRIVETIATGGAGVVHRARQESPRRDVAIKVLRLDALGSGQVVRFQREAEILAALNHPGIAQVHEAGVVNSGSLALPWIAMELVHGLPLDAYIQERRPDVPAILRIFVELCAAIEHAHERGIVHRDLKPSNVLVESSGRPRVLDFGVARVSGALEGPCGHHTRTGTVVGTLAYMSPEQARGERDSIDVRTDVYALGALLYESLTGRTAHDVDELDLIEAAHVVCFADPVPPSRVRAGLSADLDAITGKALEKDARRRYSTAGELSADIQNFLANRPVRARRPTRIDRLRKTVRRNPALTAAIVVVFVSLATALTIALVALRNQARQLAATTEAVDYFAGRITDLAPQLGFGEEMRAQLEANVERTARQLRSDPGSRTLRATQAQALYQLADLDLARSDYAAMRARLETALAIHEALVREDPSDTESWTQASSISARIGEAWRGLGDLDQRDEWFARALAIDERLAREHPDDPEYREDLGWSLERVGQAAQQRGDHETAIRLAQRRLDDARDLYARDEHSWKYMFNLSHAYAIVAEQSSLAGDVPVAAEHARECVRLARLTLDVEPGRRDFVAWLTCATGSAAEAFRRAGNLTEALAMTEDALMLAEQLALIDPRRPAHLEYVLSITRRFASAELGEPCHERAVRATGCLRRVAEAAARAGVPNTELVGAADVLSANVNRD